MPNTALNVSNKSHGLQEKLFTEKIAFFLKTLKKLLNYMLHAHDIICNLSR